MSDVFDIGGGGGGSAYNNQRKSNENYNHGRGNEWLPVDTHKDPRLSRRDKDGTRYSSNESPHFRGQHQRSHSPQHESRWQHSHSQQYAAQVPPPPPPVYSEYNSGYGSSTGQYQHDYQQQSFQQNSNNFSSHYSQQQQRGYAAAAADAASSSAQGYGNSSHQHQPGPPGDDYPSSSWAPVMQQHQQNQRVTYAQMGHQEQPRVPQPPSVTTSIVQHSDHAKTDDFKKEAAIANELKQQRATLIKQRDDYVRKSSVLRRELEKLRAQKQELISEKSPARESQRILRENAKLQLEIQTKLKSIYNVVDMLSGIIGDGLKAIDLENRILSNDNNSPKLQQHHHQHQHQQRSRKSSSRQPEHHDSDTGSNNGVGSHQLTRAKAIRASTEKDEDQARFNYVHYDPELHWCRICDVFPRTAKDLLTHLHSTEHRQVTQDHQLVDTPWHKLPADPELPSHKGAPAKRVPIKGLQFFISATAWYCKLCDIWIGDLHCASLHLKSKNHAHNYSNFVEQNPHWESNWLKDREKAYSRCAKAKQEGSVAPFPPEVPQLPNEKSKSKSRKSKGDFLDSTKEKKRKKKTKRRKKAESSGSSSSSSSTSNTSSEDESDKAKSIRVAMRNKMRMQAQMILNEELGNKVDVLEKLLGERNRKKEDPKASASASLVAAITAAPPPPPPPPDTVLEDNIINQWMTVAPSQDKHIFDHLKGRLKQRQKADAHKVNEAATEQRRRDREREERELRELREREHKEMQDKLKEKEQEEARAKEREKSRRKRDSGGSPDHYNNRRSRSRESSRGRRHFSGGHSNDRYSEESPNEKFKPKSREYEEEESHFDKRYSESFKFKQSKNQDKDNSKKLPFIGRMPLFKKKSDSGGSSSNEHGKSHSKKVKQDYQVRLSKFESGITARPFIPEPGVVHITKLATPQDPAMYINAENPPPPPKIIPEPPQISETAPSPPHINNVVTVVEDAEVQDMELDEAVALPPGVPVAEAKPIARPAGNHLPRDFQDALNIIFPGDQLPEHLAAHADPNLMLQYQYQYNMMYSNMQMQYDYSNVAQDMVEPPEETELMKEEDVVPPPPPDLDDKEDLAMLGIDAEDMAAQTF